MKEDKIQPIKIYCRKCGEIDGYYSIVPPRFKILCPQCGQDVNIKFYGKITEQVV